MRFVLPAAGAVALMALTGCNPWEQGSWWQLDTVTATLTTGADGYVKAKVPLPENSNISKMLLATTVLDGAQSVYVDRVESADGVVLRTLLTDVENSEMPTGAVAAQAINHFNWPIDAGDEPIAGDEIVVVMGAVNSDNTLADGARLDVTALLSDDSDFSQGQMQVYIHWAGGIDEDAEIKSAVEGGVAEMKRIFALHGVTVSETYLSWPEGVLPRPGFGAPDEWTALSTSTDEFGIDVVVVDTIAGSDATILGAAGSVPGGIFPSAKSGVILSAAANAGPDLIYTNAEITLLGGTLAHELGHMVGLFHPVELSYDRWDAVDDTENCQTVGACQGTLGFNLMYPTALCSSSECNLQDELTEGQTGIVQRYTGVY